MGDVGDFRAITRARRGVSDFRSEGVRSDLNRDTNGVIAIEDTVTVRKDIFVDVPIFTKAKHPFTKIACCWGVLACICFAASLFRFLTGTSVWADCVRGVAIGTGACTGVFRDLASTKSLFQITDSREATRDVFIIGDVSTKDEIFTDS